MPDGTIVQRRNPEHRTVFIETENISHTFSGIEDIIGMSIENTVVEAKRSAMLDSIDHTIPGLVKSIIRIVGARLINRNLSRLGREVGYGAINLLSMRRARGKGGFVTVSIKEPYFHSAFLRRRCRRLRSHHQARGSCDL